MIAKEQLIEELAMSANNEDEFIMKYGSEFVRDNIDKSVLTEEEKVKIKNVLTILLTDTERHKKVVEDIIEKVKGEERNEF